MVKIFWVEACGLVCVAEKNYIGMVVSGWLMYRG